LTSTDDPKNHFLEKREKKLNFENGLAKLSVLDGPINKK